MGLNGNLLNFMKKSINIDCIFFLGGGLREALVHGINGQTGGQNS